MESPVWNVKPFDSARVPGGIRTPNLLIRSQLLYPVELQTQRGAIVEVSKRDGKTELFAPPNRLVFSEET